jgi:hypothetical protein
MTAPAALDEHLRFAIAHRRLIQLSYGGHLRVVEPHDYGLKNAPRCCWDIRYAGEARHVEAGRDGGF